MEQIEILIAMGHKLFREMLCVFLNAEERFKVVGDCGDMESAVRLCRELHPHIVIMDTANSVNKHEAIQLINEHHADIKILAILQHAQLSYMNKLFRKGIFGYITTDSSTEEIINAIISIRNGGKFISDDIKNILAEQAIEATQGLGLQSVSQREMEIISFIKKGNTSREIANRLGINIRTVDAHRYNILKKLQFKNTAALVNYFSANSLIEN